MPDDGSPTYDSVQRGARALAEGIFAGIRNPLSHIEGEDLPEDEALEYLAALSILARWVDHATFDAAPDTITTPAAGSSDSVGAP